MNDVERLIAIEQIKDLKAKYFRAVDTKDGVLLRGLFTDDATADFRGAATDPSSGLNAVPGNTEEIINGGDVIADGIIAAVAALVTVHHTSVPEISILDDETASAIWPMVDRLRMPPGSPISSMVGYGHYHDTYRRDLGGWKIATLKLTRLRVDILMS